MVRDFEEVSTALGIRKWLTLGHFRGARRQRGQVPASSSAYAGPSRYVAPAPPYSSS
jgi:hypothetical protein